MTFATLVERVIGRLGQAGIPFMVTGSVASSIYGQPRATNDLDIVMDPDPTSLDALVDGLQADGFYVSSDTARSALRERTQFNAIASEGLKVDFIVRRDRPFSHAEFARRQPADLLGTPGFVATAEDVIIAKLEWAAGSNSDRQIRDVAGILAISGEDLDRDYVDRWVHALNLGHEWRRALDDVTA